MYELHSYGLLHSEISGSMCACHSPELIAAYRVLLRLLMPRHPPCALISLNSLFAELCLVLKIILKNFFLGEVEIVFYPFSKFYLLNWISYNFLFVVSLFNFQRPLHSSAFEASEWYLVEIKGIEPLTPCLQSRCSPSWAKPPFGGHKWTRTIDLTLIRRAL